MESSLTGSLLSCSWSPHSVTIDGVTTDKGAHWEMSADAGKNLKNVSPNRKKTALNMTMLIQGGKENAFNVFVCFVFLFDIFCSELSIYINVSRRCY